MMLVASCSGGGNARDGAGDARTGSLSDAVCDALARLEDVEHSLSTSAVFELDESALRESLATRRELLGDIAEDSTGELRSLLEDQLLSQTGFDEAMLDGWEQDRGRLAGAHDDAWIATVLGEGITREDGEEIRTGDYFFYKNMAYEQLVIGCRAPEQADGPAQETTEDAPPGRLVFFRPNDTSDIAAGGRLVITDSSAEDERELAPPAPWEPLGWLDAEPTGDHGILVGARQGSEFGTLVLSSTGEVLDTVQRAPGQLICPAWNRDSNQVLGLGNSSDADERRLHLIDLTGGRPSAPLDLPFASVGCGDFIGGDRVVVSDAALAPGDDRGVWTIGVDSSDPRELHVPEGCTTEVGGVDRTQTRVAVTQSCLDRLADGVWVIDLSSGEADHVVTGHAARPKWSPDGEWLVFGFSPLGEGTVLGIWQARADGRQLRQVVDPLAFSPIWLPPR
jgi:hypothetical protein